jgi:membrane-bound lytic murein transglycosylase B
VRFVQDQAAGFARAVSATWSIDKDWVRHQQWRSAFEQESHMSFSQLMSRWQPLVAEASKKFNMPAAWIRAVMQMESGGRTMLNEKQHITSPVGAVGLMQLMPGTYDEMRQQYKLGANRFDPRDNIMAGAAYLSWLHRRYGFPAMFVAYNDGPGNLEAKRDHGRALPAETRNYVAKICAVLGTSVPGTSKAKASLAKFTRPNGKPVWIDKSSVASVRAPLRGEYPRSVKAVITVGKVKQAVRETVTAARSSLRVHTRYG